MKHPEPFALGKQKLASRRVIAVLITTLMCFFAAIAHGADGSQAIRYKAPAGTLPATLHVPVEGYDGAVLPNGRFVTPVGTEFAVGAPKPFGMAVSSDGSSLATVNSGIVPFSVTLVTGLHSSSPQTTLIPLNASFLGVVFSPDGSRFYVGGGENGNVWVGDTAGAKIVGSVNLNTTAHPTGGMNVTGGPANFFRGAFTGRIAITSDGHYLYVTDQGGFQVFVIDASKIVTGVDSQGNLTEPDNFDAAIGSVRVGRYPFGIALSPDNRRLYVTNVGVFQFASLRSANPVGNNNVDFPLCYPGVGFPEETTNDRQITIHKVDPRNLPSALSFPDGIGCGYVSQDQTFTVPGLGSPNAPESSSVYVFDTSNPTDPSLITTVKPGPRIGQVQEGIRTAGGSHPNAVLIGSKYVYVSNGSDDTVSILSKNTNRELQRISLSVFGGVDRHLKGLQPVALALSPDQRTLYVAEAGINAVGVVSLAAPNGGPAQVQGLIPTGWWPSSVSLSPDGRKLYVASANGRGALPNSNTPPDNLGSPRSSTLGIVNILSVPSGKNLSDFTHRVLANNGIVPSRVPQDPNPIPSEPGVASAVIHHVIFINKENATHDLLLGDITQTRKGQPVNGDPDFSLGYVASPNHHELALQFTFSDNFFLEPSVSSDGHRWLNNNFTTELEQTHWPASYGGKRGDAGDDPNVFVPYPGRLGFTDANSSPDPNDYDEHGGIYAHLARNGKSFVNFGNGYEFAIVDEDGGTEPTGIRHHVNVPMEKILRDHSDHFYPEFNTHIPDGLLPEDPTRFGRFKQVFESRYVDREDNICKLPNYVDLYYPNDHGGGSFDINPNGPAWSFVRFVQDNDAALGETVDLISHSPCWRDTVIFAVEDDPQNGFDHVNGTRSIFLAASPWVKHQYLSNNHYSLASIFKTVDLILGIPPLNQYDAAATDLRDLFTPSADFTPYNLTPIAFDGTPNATWTAMTQNLKFSKPDMNEVELRRAIQLSEGIPHRKPGK